MTSHRRAIVRASGPTSRRPPKSPIDQLGHALEHAAHLLPAQGPIGVFVHHNTLHALEHLPFDEAVRHAAGLYGCQPYLSKESYRDELARGRIHDCDLVSVLQEDLADASSEPVLSLSTRFELRLAMVRHRVRTAPAAELRWFIANTDALERFGGGVPSDARSRALQQVRRWVSHLCDRDGNTTSGRSNGRKRSRRNGLMNVRGVAGLLAEFQRDFGSCASWTEATWERFAVRSLWEVCRVGVRLGKPALRPLPAKVRHRDVLLDAKGEDSDSLVHPLLIRFCAAFLDQGFAHWSLPDRELGFFQAFCRLYGRRGGPPVAWMRGLSTELRRLDKASCTGAESVLESLDILGVPQADWGQFITATLMALRGWAGMVHQLEVRGDRAVVAAPRGSLLDFLAVRLLLDRFALADVARRRLGFDGPLDHLRRLARGMCPRHAGRTHDERAFTVFQVAQLMGWSAVELASLTKDEWTTLESEIDGFGELDRRRVFHLAYERRFRTEVLDSLAAHHDGPSAAVEADGAMPCVPGPRATPHFQAVFCIDEREESFRRHLEEIAPDVETYGAAGFFGVAMYYRGAADAHSFPLCPVAIKPQHFVEEDVAENCQDAHQRRMGLRFVVGQALHRLHVGSRMGARGALVTSVLGVFASLPLVARVLFPRLTARLRRTAGRLIATDRTRLHIEWSAEDARLGHYEGPRKGFTVAEMADIVARLLREIGIVGRFSRLVIIVGHGSSSLNNPHESAHDCGACGGGRGGPNARAFAQMANDPRVQLRLAERGIDIPAETVFVGAYHNTCDDSLSVFDLDSLPASHRKEIRAARRQLENACERNAHERCRRFESAPLDLSPQAARRHVQARSEDLAQPRPEYGHATNAVCIVGRRQRTRGLFLDRRAFLVSYDPTSDDPAGSTLAGILAAVGPVCAGINLEYYFSFVDPTGYGCGTKLPHNIAALLGVMDGQASDLRTGLPWQMVEIHEPVRLLMVVESRPEVMAGILARSDSLRRLCDNGWIRLATLDPASAAIWKYQDGRFVRYEPQSQHLPVAANSADWYRGRREHLGFARIGITNGETWREK